MNKLVKKILLVNIFDGLYGGEWVALAPYVLKAYAEQFEISKQYDIKVLQFGRRDTVQKVIRQIKLQKPDLVGVSLYVYNIRKTLEVISGLDCLVVAGGPQVTGIETELLENNPALDLVVTGEGEGTFVKLLEYFSGNKGLREIPGITTRDFQNQANSELVDLSKVPSVIDRIIRDHPDIENICLETSRGCPYQCGYCTWSFERNMRYRDLEVVCHELDSICRHSSIKKIYLADASLFVNKDRAKKILSHLIGLAPRQEFYYEINLEHVDDELIGLMARLPRQEFCFGIQAVDSRPNKVAGRNFDERRFKEQFDKVASKLQGAQLSVDIIYPLPGDTLEGFKRSIEFALGLEKVHLIKFNPLILLPGSEYFRNKEKYGIKVKDQLVREVESCEGFSESDVREATKYANYATIMQANGSFKKVIRLIAQKQRRTVLEVMDELVRCMPSNVYNERKMPGMIAAERDDEKYAGWMIPVYLNYWRLVEELRKYTGNEYDSMLKGWIFNFRDVGFGKINYTWLVKAIRYMFKNIYKQLVLKITEGC